MQPPSQSSLAGPSVSSHLEYAHTLFLDVVQFSRLPMPTQTQVMQELQALVRGTAEFQQEAAQNELICRPTGDGMAIVFFRDVLSPVRCSLELAHALKNHPVIRVRMGIHSGLVYRVKDINFNDDVAGEGIVMAQRVMDCGDAGHILLTEDVANVLAKLSDWSRCVFDLGSCEIKHGVRLRLFSLCTRELGNKSQPRRMLVQAAEAIDYARQRANRPAPDKWKPVKNAVALFAYLFILLAGVFGALMATNNTIREDVMLTFFGERVGQPDKPLKDKPANPPNNSASAPDSTDSTGINRPSVPPSVPQPSEKYVSQTSISATHPAARHHAPTRTTRVDDTTHIFRTSFTMPADDTGAEHYFNADCQMEDGTIKSNVQTGYYPPNQEISLEFEAKGRKVTVLFYIGTQLQKKETVFASSDPPGATATGANMEGSQQNETDDGSGQ